jgi:hypothetical protein
VVEVQGDVMLMRALGRAPKTILNVYAWWWSRVR